MISRRHAVAVTIVGLIGGSSEALARTKKESSPVTRFDTDHDGTVDIDEAKKAPSDLFDRLDTDRDGSSAAAIPPRLWVVATLLPAGKGEHAPSCLSR